MLLLFLQIYGPKTREILCSYLYLYENKSEGTIAYVKNIV